MKIILNDAAAEDYRDNYRGALTDLLYMQSRHFPYQPVDVMKENIANLMIDFRTLLSDELGQLVTKKNTIQEEMKKEIQGLNRRINGFLKFLPRKTDRNKVIQFVFDFILGLEGISYLNGFGFSNRFGDKMVGNSEHANCTGLDLLKDK